MSIPITPDHVTISAEDPAVLAQVVAAILERCGGAVITVTARSQREPTILTVFDPGPHHDRRHLYGAAFTDDGREPDVSLPVIAHDDIVAVHIW